MCPVVHQYDMKSVVMKPGQHVWTDVSLQDMTEATQEQSLTDPN